MRQIKAAMTLILLLGSLALSSCKNDGITLDKAATVSYDPVKDKPLPPGGGPAAGAGPAMKGKKGAPSGAGK